VVEQLGKTVELAAEDAETSQVSSNLIEVKSTRAAQRPSTRFVPAPK
jgi:hypothetical protein